jgi:hypothetical protein
MMTTWLVNFPKTTLGSLVNIQQKNFLEKGMTMEEVTSVDSPGKKGRKI